MAHLVWERYMQRSKIENVFRFCKQELKWEAPRIDDWNDWTTMKNLLSLVYFIAGYFWEIKHELTKDPQAQALAQIGGGKGKVTLHFLLKGITKIINYLETKNLIDNQQLDEKQLIKAATNFG